MFKHRSGFTLPEEEVTDVAQLMNSISEQNGLEQMISFLELLKKFCAIPHLRKLSVLSDMASVSEHEGIRLGNIYHFIMVNYSRQITLEDVAAQAHITIDTNNTNTFETTPNHSVLAY